MKMALLVRVYVLCIILSYVCCTAAPPPGSGPEKITFLKCFFVLLLFLFSASFLLEFQAHCSYT